MNATRILIVDDEINIRLMLRTVLEGDGYAVEEASNGREALDKIAGMHFAVALLDLNMPVLDGMGVLEQLHAQGKSASIALPKVVVLTAYGSIQAAVKATRLGAVDFLEKPIAPDELRDEVRSLLADKPSPTDVQERAAQLDLSGGYEAVLIRIRKALRADDLASAESMLMRAADLSAGREAPYFNLLGALYEVQRNWRLAKKFYGKAMRADRHYGPAETNVRRMYELDSFGRTAHRVALGDEPPVTALEQLLEEQKRGHRTRH